MAATYALLAFFAGVVITDPGRFIHSFVGILTIAEGEELPATEKKSAWPNRVSYGDGVHHNTEFDASLADLEALITKHTSGMLVIGKPIAGRLEAFTPVAMEIPAMTCSVVSLRLSEDALFSDHARQGVEFEAMWGDSDEVKRLGPGIKGPGGVADLGCRSKKKVVDLDLQANFGSALSTARIHELGRGGFTVQLYGRKATKREIAEQNELTTKALERANQDSRAYIIKRCNKCRIEYERCELRGSRPYGASCFAEARNCLNQHGIDSNKCAKEGINMIISP